MEHRKLYLVLQDFDGEVRATWAVGNGHPASESVYRLGFQEWLNLQSLVTMEVRSQNEKDGL